MNNIEKIEEAIGAKMTEIETYESIKRLNSYVVFAQFLEWHMDTCFAKANDKISREGVRKEVEKLLKGGRDNGT